MASKNMRYRDLAAAILLFAFVGWFFVDTTRTKFAFAEVVENVRAAQTMRYKLISKFDDKPETVSIRLVKVGLQRIEDADGTISICVNRPDRVEILTLDPIRRLAVLDATVHPPLDPLSAFQGDPAKWGESGKREPIDGKEAIIYQSPEPGSDVMVWVDAETRLPLQIKTQTVAHKLATGGQQSGLTLVWRDFEWDVDIEDSLFSFEVPQGYTIVRNEPLDLTSVTERDLIEALRQWTAASGGTLPQRNDLGNLMQTQIVQMMQESNLLTKDDELDDNSKKKARHVFLQAARGDLFIAQLAGQGCWHYTGNGVKLGEADKPVAWWKTTKDAKTYRVLYGDLSIKDVAEEDLPEVPKSTKGE